MKEGLLENIEISLYRVIINLVIHETCQEAVNTTTFLRKACKKRNIKFSHEFGSFLFFEKENIYAIVLREDADIDTVSHECFHATMCILKAKGIIYSNKSEEVFAYVLGFLTKTVWDMRNGYINNIK